jgi:hypothetical protein
MRSSTSVRIDDEAKLIASEVPSERMKKENILLLYRRVEIYSEGGVIPFYVIGYNFRK